MKYALKLLLHTERELKAKPDALMIDIADERAEARVGMLLEEMARQETPLFVLGSSGVEYALVAFWRAQGAVPTQVSMPSPGAVDRLLVVSGSCSPATGAQIAAARSDGFAEVALDPVALLVEGEEGQHEPHRRNHLRYKRNTPTARSATHSVSVRAATRGGSAP